MKIEIKPEKTGGEVFVPPSKSITHRAIFAAALADGRSQIDHVLLSQDVRTTIEAVRDFGATVQLVQESPDGLFTLYVDGNPNPKTQDTLIDCCESGTTARFIIPILAVDADNTVIVGQGNLNKRPEKVYFDIFDEQGYDYARYDEQLPLILNDKLKPGEFEIRGDISSQFLSGLFFALPLLDGDSTITLTSKLQSKPYVDLTIEVLEEFGITIEELDNQYFIKGNQKYTPSNIIVDGDYSQAAFWFANGMINKETKLINLNPNTLQGDSSIIPLIESIGGKILYNDENQTFTSKEAQGISFEVDVSNIPDLVPILAVIAALSSGVSELYSAKRLRYKESNRLHSTTEMLRSYGVEVEELDDKLIIHGTNSFTPAEIDTYNDHRIAIAAAIASGRATGNVIIDHAQCVNKSYPTFWDDFRSVGGNFNELDLG